MAGKKKTKGKTTAGARKTNAKGTAKTKGAAKASKAGTATKKVAKAKAKAAPKTKPKTAGIETGTKIDSKVDPKVDPKTKSSTKTRTPSEKKGKAKSVGKANLSVATKTSGKLRAEPEAESTSKSKSKSKSSARKPGPLANANSSVETKATAKTKAKVKARGEAETGGSKKSKKLDADVRQSEGAPTQDPPSAGTIAPDFSLPTDDGTELRLTDLRGRRVVLYFYPKDMTPGCTQEACSFRDAHDEFLRRNTVILGVSRDTSLKHQRFREKERLPFRLLSDADAAVIRAYGSWGPKKFMGRSFDGILRTTVVIGEDGRVAKVYSKVSPKEHAKQILADLDARS